MKNNEWFSVDSLPEKVGKYWVKTNDGEEFYAFLGNFGQWRHQHAGLHADLYPSKEHPDWTDPGGGMRNVQKRQVTHYKMIKSYE